MPLNDVFLEVVCQSQLAKGRPCEISKTYQCVSLGFLEIVAAVERVEPCVQEELRPFTPPDQEAPLAETFVILCEDQINLVALQMRKGPDDTVWWNDWLIPDHQGLEALRIQKMRFERYRWVHN